MQKGNEACRFRIEYKFGELSVTHYLSVIICTSYKESCEDVNECFGILNNCHQNGFCTNSEAAFNCECNKGYEGDGVTCDDIDECSQKDICPEHAVCENSDGSYDCICEPGFKDAKNGCIDVDECRDECNDASQETLVPSTHTTYI